MNLVDAIKLYCHIMQAGGGREGRENARAELLKQNISTDVCHIIAESVSNDGHLTSGNGATFALTQISTS